MKLSPVPLSSCAWLSRNRFPLTSRSCSCRLRRASVLSRISVRILSSSTAEMPIHGAYSTPFAFRRLEIFFVFFSSCSTITSISSSMDSASSAAASETILSRAAWASATVSTAAVEGSATAVGAAGASAGAAAASSGSSSCAKKGTLPMARHDGPPLLHDAVLLRERAAWDAAGENAAVCEGPARRATAAVEATFIVYRLYFLESSSVRVRQGTEDGTGRDGTVWRVVG